MKHTRKKIITLILIQIFMLIEISAAGSVAALTNIPESTLSPALQLPSGVFQQMFLNAGAIKTINSLNVVLKDKGLKNNKHTAEIEIKFRHNVPGVLNSILHSLSSDVEVVWFEMSRRPKMNTLRIAVSTPKEDLIADTIMHLSKIADNKKHDKKRGKVKLCVLNLSIKQKPQKLILITEYLSSNGINVSKFLTPRAEEGYFHYVFEVEVPQAISVDAIEADLKDIAKFIDGKVKLNRGKLINTILNESLLDKINTTFYKRARHYLLRALRIVGRRHISESRKDRKTPFIMHQVEVARILVNEIRVLSPHVMYLVAKTLKIGKEQAKTEILLAALLHDALEDKDISKAQLRKRFGKRVSIMVGLLSKESVHRNKKGEAVYLDRMLNRKDMVGVGAQIIKLADRIHNLRTLVDNEKEFQRKIFFSTLNTFIPAFVSKIDLSSLEDQSMRHVFERAIELFEDQVYITGKKLGFMDEAGKINKQQHELYLLEEQLRQEQMILEIAQTKKLLAHGVDMTKVGTAGLADILVNGYIKARDTKFGQVVFAGPLRPQEEDEEYMDYIAESSGDYGPYYIILDPVIEKLRIEEEIDGEKILLPGFYKAEQVAEDKWGLSNKYHAAYLVPKEEDRNYLIEKIELAVVQSKMDAANAKMIISKIITYFEFVQAKEAVCMLKLDQENAEAQYIGKKVHNLSCPLFVEQAI